MQIFSLIIPLVSHPEIEAAERQRLIENVIGLSLSAIVAGILFYIYFRYLHYKLKGEFRYKSKFNEYNHVDALVILSMNVLRSHPICWQEKCLYIKEYIVYLYPNNSSFFESLRWSYKDIYSSQSLVKWLNKHLDKNAIENDIRFLIHMAAIDGVIASKEREELVDIIEAFQVETSVWLEMMDSINQEFQDRRNSWRKKEEPISYHDSIVVKALAYFEMSKEILNATILRKKYLKFAKKFHPDSSPHATLNERKELEIKFQEVQLYYDELLKLL